MTQNQIAYWNLRETESNNSQVRAETKRANQAKELENNRHNLATENLQLQANMETARSNQTREGLTFQQLLEANRSNLANERLKDAQIQAGIYSSELGYAASKYAADAASAASIFGSNMHYNGVRYQADVNSEIQQLQREMQDKHFNADLALRRFTAVLGNSTNISNAHLRAYVDQEIANGRNRTEILKSLINAASQAANNSIRTAGGAVGALAGM